MWPVLSLDGLYYLVSLLCLNSLTRTEEGVQCPSLALCVVLHCIWIWDGADSVAWVIHPRWWMSPTWDHLPWAQQVSSQWIQRFLASQTGAPAVDLWGTAWEPRQALPDGPWLKFPHSVNNLWLQLLWAWISSSAFFSHFYVLWVHLGTFWL